LWKKGGRFCLVTTKKKEREGEGQHGKERKGAARHQSPQKREGRTKGRRRGGVTAFINFYSEGKREKGLYLYLALQGREGDHRGKKRGRFYAPVVYTRRKEKKIEVALSPPQRRENRVGEGGMIGHDVLNKNEGGETTCNEGNEMYSALLTGGIKKEGGRKENLRDSPAIEKKGRRKRRGCCSTAGGKVQEEKKRPVR